LRASPATIVYQEDQYNQSIRNKAKVKTDSDLCESEGEILERKKEKLENAWSQ
jgi:hypothetical protein